jgi:anti-sigma B factor antagonist
METRLEKVGDVQVVELKGRLDLSASPELGQLLQRLIVAGESKIVLDCRELNYVSSSGLGAFIAAGKNLGAGGKLVFAGLNNHLQNLFEMTGINGLFEVCPTREDAVARLGAAS